MSMKASTRVVNDVVIVDVRGRITLGEGSVVLRDTIKDLLGKGNRKILLNLGDVSYIDSSGVGEIFMALTAVVKQGGMMRLLHLTTKVRDLLVITKLYSAIENLDDEALGLKSFEFVSYCKCPCCGSLGRPPCLDPLLRLVPQQICPNCDARFIVNSARRREGRIMIIQQVRLQSYEQEHFEVVSGPPYTVRIVGRLNLFSSSALDKTWRVIPPPRRVIFDLRSVTDVDTPGRDALLTFLLKKEAGAKAAISLGGLNCAFSDAFLLVRDAYPDKERALAALGDVSDTPEWLGEFVEMKPCGGR